MSNSFWNSFRIVNGGSYINPIPSRPVFFVSDRTGLTAEAVGHTLLTQFPSVRFEPITIPFVDTEKKAEKVLERINEITLKTGQKPIVFSTIIAPPIRKILAKAHALTLNFFDIFLEPLERELQTGSSHTVGMAHAIQKNHYQLRIEAINFALASDDGLNTDHYTKAEVILTGVSRSGKTPTCLYLALQFSLFAANYPLVLDDLEHHSLPKLLLPHQNKLFGLTILPTRLMNIRQARRKTGSYASLEQCEKEVKLSESLMKHMNIPFLNTSNRSIEEIATKILAKMKLRRHSF